MFLNYKRTWQGTALLSSFSFHEPGKSTRGELEEHTPFGLKNIYLALDS